MKFREFKINIDDLQFNVVEAKKKHTFYLVFLFLNTQF